jgi:hypothetical protein
MQTREGVSIPEWMGKTIHSMRTPRQFRGTLPKIVLLVALLVSFAVISDIVVHQGQGRRARDYNSQMRIGGWPVLSIGHNARGIFAFGDVATGVIAGGGVAVGVVAYGLVSLGAMTFGVFSFGLYAVGSVALGGRAFGAISIGHQAAGAIAIGNYACGAIAVGRKAASGSIERIVG